MKRCLRRWGMFIIRIFGTKIRDAKNGQELGRALVVTWRGVIYLIGFDGARPVRPIFLPEASVIYWRQRIGFVSVDEPDFPRHEQRK